MYSSDILHGQAPRMVFNYEPYACVKHSKRRPGDNHQDTPDTTEERKMPLLTMTTITEFTVLFVTIGVCTDLSFSLFTAVLQAEPFPG